MLIFSSKCIHHVLITIILQIGIIQVESTFSSSAAKIRRTQSIREPRTRSASPAAAASQKVVSESKPKASTSAYQPETQLHSLIEKESKHVNIASSASLIDSMTGTQSEHLDPTRDGYFARMRNRMLRYGSAVAIGSAIGAGGLAAGELAVNHLLYQNNNNTTQPMNTTQILSDETDNDISNPS